MTATPTTITRQRAGAPGRLVRDGEVDKRPPGASYPRPDVFRLPDIVAEDRGLFTSDPTAADRDGCPSSDRDVDLAGVVDRAGQVLGDPGRLAALSAAGLRDRIGLLRRLEGQTVVALAAAVGALDRCGGIDADGAPSKTEWLKANTGRSGRDAAQVARLAAGLETLPGTADALAAGALTAESADAVILASRDMRLGSPEQVETQLLDLATRTTPEQLRRHIRKRQQAADPDAMIRDENRQHVLRSFRLVRMPDGMWRPSGALPGEVGEKFLTVLDSFATSDPKDTPTGDSNGPSAGRHRRPDQRLADALADMTDTILSAGLTPGNGGIVRPHLSVIIDTATVSADLTDPDAPDPEAADAAVAPDDPVWAGLPAGETGWGGLLSPQAVRRICCDAAVSRIITAGGSQILDVGRATRNWSQPQRRAINARDRHCRGPNCTRPIGWTSVHHLKWWRNHGDTAITNGIALCYHCHRLIHDRGWTLKLDPTTADATWTSPAGQTTTTQVRRR